MSQRTLAELHGERGGRCLQTTEVFEYTAAANHHWKRSASPPHAAFKERQSSNLENCVHTGVAKFVGFTPNRDELISYSYEIQ